MKQLLGDVYCNPNACGDEKGSQVLATQKRLKFWCEDLSFKILLQKSSMGCEVGNTQTSQPDSKHLP